MPKHMSMIYFRSSGYDLDAAGHSFITHGLSVSHDNQELTVRWGDGPTLRIRLSTAAVVQQEARELSKRNSDTSAIRDCDVRFEILIDNLDEVLDEINTLIEVQATLQDATNGFLFNTWNRRLSPRRKM